VKPAQFQKETMCSVLMLLTHVIYFGDSHGFLQRCWISLFVTKRGFLHLVHSHWQEVFLGKLTHFSKANNVLDAEVCNINGFL
jgi:hypothetical protein